MVVANDYYAFGMLMPGRNQSSDSYRYGFNGMEKDDEVKGTGNSYDFGARLLDVRLGRWLSVDPYWKKYMPISTYHFTLNKPIVFKDNNGKEVTDADGKPIAVTFKPETNVLLIKGGDWFDHLVIEDLFRTEKGRALFKVIDDLEQKYSFELMARGYVEGVAYGPERKIVGTGAPKRYLALIEKLYGKGMSYYNTTDSKNLLSDEEWSLLDRYDGGDLSFTVFNEETGVEDMNYEKSDVVMILVHPDKLLLPKDKEAFYNGNLSNGPRPPLINHDDFLRVMVEEIYHVEMGWVQINKSEFNPETGKYTKSKERIDYELQPHELEAKAKTAAFMQDWKENKANIIVNPDK
ncbi:MAG: hypothetical protein H6581_31045 [Bacteroidia bacterium]|nr:hypothetical protein [Bacteroidia bacterium]